MLHRIMAFISQPPMLQADYPTQPVWSPECLIHELGQVYHVLWPVLQATVHAACVCTARLLWIVWAPARHVLPPTQYCNPMCTAAGISLAPGTHMTTVSVAGWKQTAHWLQRRAGTREQPQSLPTCISVGSGTLLAPQAITCSCLTAFITTLCRHCDAGRPDHHRRLRTEQPMVSRPGCGTVLPTKPQPAGACGTDAGPLFSTHRPARSPQTQIGVLPTCTAMPGYAGGAGTIMSCELQFILVAWCTCLVLCASCLARHATPWQPSPPSALLLAIPQTATLWLAACPTLP